MDDMIKDWYGPDAATFGDRVAAARESAGMSHEMLARKLGIKLSTLKNWENDVAEPRANKLSMMAGILNVSIMWLLNGEGEGLEPPTDAPGLSGDMSGLLTELRELKATMKTSTDRLGRLEKRLRATLAQPVE